MLVVPQEGPDQALVATAVHVLSSQLPSIKDPIRLAVDSMKERSRLQW